MRVTQAQAHHSVIIREIMADPSPSAGLPACEWIEIQNNSTLPVQLQNWRLADLNSQSGMLPSFLLLPDSSLILCSTSALSLMRNYGTAIGISSFPSLDNTGNTILLRSSKGQTIHAVSYESSWYRSSLKEEGGWSLEMINTLEPCLGKDNWTASTSPQGGTPGKTNSVNSHKDMATAPSLLHAYATDSFSIILVFDRTLDSALVAVAANYRIQKDLYSVARIRALAPLFSLVELQLSSSLKADSIINIEVKNIQTCTGKQITGTQAIQAGWASNPAKGDWMINEILFNPTSSGVDFLECYNNSKRILDLSKLFICSRKSTGDLGTATQLHPEPFLVFPGEYYCFTEDPFALAREYLVTDNKKILMHDKLPSFPDTEGTVVLLDREGNMLDELHYQEDWHFPLLTNREGVSLERIHPNHSTQNADNWHSAASTEGYATPGRKNSQQKNDETTTVLFEVSPKVFSPDMDGQDDVCSLSYTMKEPGQMAIVSILSTEGRVIRTLVPKATLSMKGQWNWDGLDDRGRIVLPGIYLFVVKQFDLNGKVRQYRLPIILARSFS